MLLYTLYRALIFAACLGLLWLVGLRGQANMFYLVIGAALLSAVISYFGLRKYREDYSREIAERFEARAKARAAKHGVADEAAEDVEDSAAG